MPWCEECSKYWTPSSMNEDGTCPQCGAQITDTHEHPSASAEDEKAPWHFKLLVVLVIAYLVWRLVQLLT
jgi:predicted amidophosphoribosyltransferase